MTTTGNVVSSGNLDILIERTAIENFESTNYFWNMGEQRSLPNTYNSYTFNLTDTNEFTAAQAKLTEGVSPVAGSHSFRQVNVSLQEYGRTISFSNLAVSDSPVDIYTDAAMEAGRVMANVIDDEIQTTLLNGTNVLYGGTVSARASLTATDVITGSKVAETVAKLRGNDAPTYDGNAYVAVIHPDVQYDLLTDSTVQGLLDNKKYVTPENYMKGEIGMAFGCRFVVSSNAKILADAGSGNVDVYPVFMMGQKAYGVVKAGGIKTTLIRPEQIDKTDPLGQKGSVGIYTRFGSEILKEDSLYRIEVASSIGANS